MNLGTLSRPVPCIAAFPPQRGLASLGWQVDELGSEDGEATLGAECLTPGRSHRRSRMGKDRCVPPRMASHPSAHLPGEQRGHQHLPEVLRLLCQHHQLPPAPPHGQQ